MKKKLYVLVSNRLKSIYAAVQGGHAVAAYMLDNEGKGKSWKNSTIVYLSCNVHKMRGLLQFKGIPFSEWHEEDLGDELTAIAVYSDGAIFKKLKTLR